MKKRLFLGTAGVVVIALSVAFLLAMPFVQNLYKAEFQKRLDTVLALMLAETDEIDTDPQTYAEEQSRFLREAGQPVRISVISADGWVVGDSNLYDSEEGVITGVNHLDRPEIKEAMEEGRGYDVRLSATVNTRYFYAAVCYRDAYFLRAALPMTELDTTINNLTLCALAGVGVGILAALIAAVFLGKWLARPLDELTLASRNMAAGEYEARVPVRYKGEVGDLAAAFNTMADHLSEAFDVLRQKQGQLEDVLQGMDDGVLAVDESDRVLLLNERARSLLDCPMLSDGKPLGGNLAASQLAEVISGVRRTAQPERLSLKTGAPAERELSLYVAPLSGDATPGGVLAVLADVTEMRRLQQLRSEFVANVTHELKTPLTSIRGFIELLKDGDRDEETRSYFYDVLDIEAERLHHLIDDMLVLSQIENAREESSLKKCDLKKELESTLERMRPAAEKAGVSLCLEAKEPLFVASSPTRLQQLFGNLIENAVKYNKPEGSVTVSLQRQRQTAVVRVADTGIGIAPEHFDRLFERFYRVDSSRSREIGGTGLGLSIVKHLVSLYNGEVSVESKPGEGSTFTVRLPLWSRTQEE